MQQTRNIQQTLPIKYMKLNFIKHKQYMSVFVVVSSIIKEQVILHNKSKHIMIGIIDPSCVEPCAIYQDIPVHIFLNDLKDKFNQPFEVGDVLRIHNLLGDLYPKEDKMYGKIFSTKSVVKFKLREENNQVTPITTNSAYKLTDHDIQIVKELRMFWRKRLREKYKNDHLLDKNICEVDSPCIFNANCVVKRIRFDKTESVAVLTVTDQKYRNNLDQTIRVNSEKNNTKVTEQGTSRHSNSRKRKTTTTTGKLNRQINVTVFEPLTKKLSTLKVGQSIRLLNVICVLRGKFRRPLDHSHLDFYMTSEKGDIKQVGQHVFNPVSIRSDEEASCSTQPERLEQNCGAIRPRILKNIKKPSVVAKPVDEDSQSTETPPSGQLDEEPDCEIIEPVMEFINLDDSNVSEDPNNERSENNYSEEINEAKIIDDEEGSDSRVFVKGLDKRTDVNVFKSPESSLLLGNDNELENQTPRDNIDTDNTQDSEVIGNPPSKKRKICYEKSGVSVPPKQISSNNWENLEVEFYTNVVNKDILENGGSTEESEDIRRDTEVSEDSEGGGVIAKSVDERRKVPPESSMELVNDDVEMNEVSDDDDSCVEETGDNIREVEPPVSSMVLENNNGLENQAPRDDDNSSQQLEPQNTTSKSHSHRKRRKRYEYMCNMPNEPLHDWINSNSMEMNEVSDDDDSYVEETGDNIREVEPPVSSMVLENNNELENRAPRDDDNSSQQLEPQNTTSKSHSDRKRRKIYEYMCNMPNENSPHDWINTDSISNENEDKNKNKKRSISKFCKKSKPGEKGLVWVILKSINTVSGEPCNKCRDVNCYHDWTWGMCRECGAEFSSSDLRKCYSTSDLIKSKELQCFMCSIPNPAATIKPLFKLTVCLEDMVTNAEFAVELSGDFAEEFFGIQPTFKWTIEAAPETFDFMIANFHSECSRKSFPLTVNKIYTRDGLNSLRICDTKFPT